MMQTFGTPLEQCTCAWTRSPIKNARCSVLYAPIDQPDIAGVNVIRVENPRLAFAQVYNAKRDHVPGPLACVRVAENCLIHETAVLGSDGFGYEWSGSEWVHFPHIGGVSIAEDVRIGAHTCVDRGSLGDTVIRRGAKIDNLVHIAHNADIGEHAIIVAHALICGSATIGTRAWIGGGAIVKEGVTVGAGAIVGLGAVVTKDIPPGETWAGIPARRLNT